MAGYLFKTTCHRGEVKQSKSKAQSISASTQYYLLSYCEALVDLLRVLSAKLMKISRGTLL